MQQVTYSQEEKDKILKAGKIAKQVREWITPQVKKGVSLLEIANKIEDKMEELGGKPAFPTNLSINEIAAHYTPAHDDETLAHGLLKIDFGVHVDGWASDQAFTIDLENSEENRKLIESAKSALDESIKLVQNKKTKTTLGEIGYTIEKTIQSKNHLPIRNLSGHEIDHYDLHAGQTIPNYNTNDSEELDVGIKAIEPFSTTASGAGKVRDGKPSGIYMLVAEKNVRSPIAREVLNFIIEKFETLPFCERWIFKEFGSRGLLGLRQLESNGNLHHFKQLVEANSAKVAQAEHTLFLEGENVTITTL